jgi:hypothetical protein
MRVSIERHASPPIVFLLRFIALAVALSEWPSAAQIVLGDNNSVVSIDPYSQRGMYGWAIDGQPELQQQWFWYGVGNGAVQSIDTITPAPGVVETGTRELTTTYVSPNNFSLSIDYQLTGNPGAVGSVQHAQIGETITIVNLSATRLPYHFYQYAYFNLGAASRDVAQLGQDALGKYSEAIQSNSAATVTETIAAQGADHGEVAPLGLTLAKLNGGGPATLGSPFGAGPVGPGGVTWALEWDLNILPGASAIISENQTLDVLSVPEPSAQSLIGVASLVFLLLRRSGKSAGWADAAFFRQDR